MSRTALIDADILVYEVGVQGQYIDPYLDPDNNLIIKSFDHVKEVMDQKIAEIVRRSESDDVRVFLSGPNNFRKEIAKKKVYKDNRKDSVKPYHYDNLRAYLISSYKAEVSDGIEADDAICIAQIENAKEYGVRVPFHKGYYYLDYEDWVRFSDTHFIQDGNGYLINDTGKGATRKIWSLHREIMGNPEGLVVDHINGDILDNRKYNLRVCTTKENIRNSKPQEGTSTYKGVSWDKDRNKWIAQIKVDRKGIHLGRFDSEIQAAEAYDNAAINYYGEYARLNLQSVYTKPWKETIICSRDKDLRQCPLLHYTWECGAQPEKSPYLVEGFGELVPHYDKKGKIDRLYGTGDKWFLAQMLMGDSTDHIPGLPGRGPVRVLGALLDIDKYEDGLSIVVNEYVDYYEDSWKEELEEQAALVWMIRERNEDGSPKHWRLCNA